MSFNDVDEQLETGAADIFETPVIEVPRAQPEAHRAVITSVESGHSSEKGTPFVQINWQSRDVPTIEDNMKIWIPKMVEESGFSAKFNPKSMESPQQTSFRMGIASSDRRATLQELVFNAEGDVEIEEGKKPLHVKNSLARAAGRDPVELGLKAAHTLEEYAANIHAMLQGLECVVVRKAKGGDDPAFANRLEAKAFLPADIAETNPKRLKGLRLVWES